MDSEVECKATAVWLCGQPRLVREALGLVLDKNLQEIVITEICDLEPPELILSKEVVWLVWLLVGKQGIPATIETLSAQPWTGNLLLIQNDGHAFVRWTDARELHLRDISLERVIGMLRTSLESPAPSASFTNLS